ncbi:cytochrome-c oxidase [Virgibacillus indicus]|uniref:Cytochrome-c oxidase n=1 Tax=Virgibacillus indicus TaxID=2024554 RepID=A0A265N6E3_9BACI|nr:cytochrome-c oxidase [Virgibacillus indicus]OZU87417.1 cytochrome-c oxidase [Virgibacillus indicus]
MGVKFIKVSVVYFLIGATLGIYMGMADLFQFTSAHAHINLLGWASLALTGLIYHVFPLAGENKLAAAHFWLHMVGIPLLTFSMILFGLAKFEIAVPLSAVGGILVFIGVVLFVINVMKNVKRSAA